jgi:hypothetical protein
MAASHAFPALFTDIEAQSALLGVETWGVSVTTMEEVFLKVVSVRGSAPRSSPRYRGRHHSRRVVSCAGR